jgi:hypothetical protein
LEHTFGTYNYWLVAPSLGIALAPSRTTVDEAKTEAGRGLTLVIPSAYEANYASRGQRVAA